MEIVLKRGLKPCGGSAKGLATRGRFGCASEGKVVAAFGNFLLWLNDVIDYESYAAAISSEGRRHGLDDVALLLLLLEQFHLFSKLRVF